MLDEILARGNLRLAFERVRENHGCRGAEGGRPTLPPPLDLWAYLELKPLRAKP